MEDCTLQKTIKKSLRIKNLLRLFLTCWLTQTTILSTRLGNPTRCSRAPSFASSAAKCRRFCGHTSKARLGHRRPACPVLTSPLFNTDRPLCKDFLLFHDTRVGSAFPIRRYADLRLTIVFVPFFFPPEQVCNPELEHLVGCGECEWEGLYCVVQRDHKNAKWYLLSVGVMVCAVWVWYCVCLN